jgi:hypothetical protein
VAALPVYATPVTRACRTPLCWTPLHPRFGQALRDRDVLGAYLLEEMTGS